VREDISWSSPAIGATITATDFLTFPLVRKMMRTVKARAEGADA
jgi:hypothetical protein